MNGIDTMSPPADTPPDESPEAEEAEVIDQTHGDLDALRKLIDAMVEAQKSGFGEEALEDTVKAFEASSVDKEQQIALIQGQIDKVGAQEDVKKMLEELKNRIEGKKKGWLGGTWDKTPGWAKSSLMWVSGIALFKWLYDKYKGQEVTAWSRTKSIFKSALMITGISFAIHKVQGLWGKKKTTAPTTVAEEAPKVEQMKEMEFDTGDEAETGEDEKIAMDEGAKPEESKEEKKPIEQVFKPKIEGERLHITKGNEAYKVNIGKNGIDLSQFLINPATAENKKDLTATVAFDTKSRNRNMYAKLYEQLRVAEAEEGRGWFDAAIDFDQKDKSAGEGVKLSLAINDFLLTNPNLGKIRIKNISDSLKAVKDGNTLALDIEFEVNKDHETEMGTILDLAKEYKEAIKALDPGKRTHDHEEVAKSLDEILPILTSVRTSGSYVNNDVQCSLERI